MTAQTSARLEIRNLVRRFGDNTVVDDVSLQIGPGRVTCLLGPSGCGKSTTLRMIAGVEMQDAGEIYLDGKLICDTVFRVPPERRSIGLMFQDFALFPHLTVGENVAFGLTGSGGQKKERSSFLLDRVGLGHYVDSYPHNLSGGEQQRVALARALAPQPRVMLMDEPFSGLDNRLRDGIRDETLALLKDEGASVLLVTHEPEEAMRMADEILLMRQGKVVQRGAPLEIYRAPADKAAAAFFSDINTLEGEVQAGHVATPFGHFDAGDIPDGTQVDVVFRPQHVHIDFDRAGREPSVTHQAGAAVRSVVERSRFMGSNSLIEFKTEKEGAVFTAIVPAVFLPKAGDFFWLTVPRDRFFVFPTQR